MIVRGLFSVFCICILSFTSLLFSLTCISSVWGLSSSVLVVASSCIDAVIVGVAISSSSCSSFCTYT